MDLLDRLLDHDHWATTQLLDVSRNLTDAQLDQEFDIGHRSLRGTIAAAATGDTIELDKVLLGGPDELIAHLLRSGEVGVGDGGKCAHVLLLPGGGFWLNPPAARAQRQ